VNQRRALLYAALLMALAAPATIFVGGAADRAAGTTPLPRPLRDAIPTELAGWKMTLEDDLAERYVEMTRVDDYVSRRYVDADGGHLTLYVAYHGNKERGIGTLYHNASVCYPAAGWELAEEHFATLVLRESARAVPTCRYLFRRGPAMLSVLTFFAVDGELLDQSPRNKPFWLLADRLTPEIDHDPGTFLQVQVVGTVEPGEEEAVSRRQERFLQDFGGAIFRSVP